MSASAPFRLFDHVPTGIFVCGEDLGVVFWNSTMEDWTGLHRGEALGEPLPSLFPRFASDSFKARLDLLREGGPPVIFSYQLNGCIFPHRDPKRIERVQHVTAAGFTDEDGRRLLLFAVEDRTEVASRIRAARSELARRIETEESLRKSVDEKEFLMRELNHRVKNNLNMISSLINLQKDSVVEDSLRSVLDDLNGRIRSFATLHESMHQKDARSTLKLDDYLGTIALDLFETVKPSYSNARLDIDLEEIERPFQEALYMGLIVSEALTNAMKYGLGPAGDGRISIRLRSRGRELELEIADDGEGFPQGFDAETTESLGVKLIWLLAGELKGKARFVSEKGARVVVSFNTDSE